ncbi:MAG: hypothetical protein ACF8R7_16430 [Phycisphaerales bacterium JB039]
MPSLRMTVAMCVIGAWRVPALGQCELVKLVGDPARAGATLGTSVSASGNAIIAGAPGEDASGRNSGAAYVFRRSAGAWSQEQRLIPADPRADAFFGWSVAIDGNLAAVGAYGDDEFALIGGAVYTYAFDGATWNQTGKLVAPVPDERDSFGYAVAMEGNLLFVGAPNDDEMATASGAVHVYRHDGGGWVHEAKLTSATSGANAGFGAALDTDRGAVLVGVPAGSDVRFFGGAAILFRQGPAGWERRATLAPDAAVVAAAFGESVAYDDPVAVVGARLENTGASGSGAAYVFRRSDPENWEEEARLAPEAPAGAFDQFGGSVAISGSVIAVGAFGRDAPEQDSGEVSVFGGLGGTAWFLVDSFTAPDAAAFDHFGRALAFSEGRLVATSDGQDEAAENAGAAYVLSADEIPFEYLVNPDASPFEFFGTIPPLIRSETTAHIQGAVRGKFITECGELSKVQVTELDLETREGAIELTAPGATFRVTDPRMRMSDSRGVVGPPAALSDIAAFLQAGNKVAIEGMLSYDVLGFQGMEDLSMRPAQPAELPGAFLESGFSRLTASLDLEFEVDLGLGALNPTLGAIGDLMADEVSVCYADCDGSGALDFFDFLCFQNAFATGDPYADCDATGVLDFFDFLCFQNAFAAGCP